MNWAVLFPFRGILLAEEQRYNEAVRSYESAIHFRPRLAGERKYEQCDMQSAKHF